MINLIRQTLSSHFVLFVPRPQVLSDNPPKLPQGYSLCAFTSVDRDRHGELASTPIGSGTGERYAKVPLDGALRLGEGSSKGKSPANVAKGGGGDRAGGSGGGSGGKKGGKKGGDDGDDGDKGTQDKKSHKKKAARVKDTKSHKKGAGSSSAAASSSAEVDPPAKKRGPGRPLGSLGSGKKGKKSHKKTAPAAKKKDPSKHQYGSILHAAEAAVEDLASSSASHASSSSTAAASSSSASSSSSSRPAKGAADKKRQRSSGRPDPLVDPRDGAARVGNLDYLDLIGGDDGINKVRRCV
jgi:hypothetical protein